MAKCVGNGVLRLRSQVVAYLFIRECVHHSFSSQLHDALCYMILLFGGLCCLLCGLLSLLRLHLQRRWPGKCTTSPARLPLEAPVSFAQSPQRLRWRLCGAVSANFRVVFGSQACLGRMDSKEKESNFCPLRHSRQRMSVWAPPEISKL